MDAAVEPGVREVVVIKGARIGYSEAWKNVLGYWIDAAPDPTMFVLPDKESADKIVQGDIRPLLQETPKLRQYLSEDKSDNKLSLMRLTTMEITTAWAGSAQSLASSNQRRVLFDETDKYPAFSGREANPISLGMARAATYEAIGRAFYMLGSTPTTRVGHISRQAEGCTQHRYWHVPCPKCGEVQRVVWSQVRWTPQRDSEDRIQWSERVRDSGDVWYECRACQHKIAEQHKPRLMNAGRWVEDVPGSSNARVCFHAPSYISLMISWAQIASDFLRAKGDPALMMHVVNSHFGEAFEETSSTVKVGAIRDKAKMAAPPMIVPPWSKIVIATSDVQKDYLRYTVRAWGAGNRSALLRYGNATTFEELARLVFQQGFPLQTGELVSAFYLGLDSRYRTDEVLAFAQNDPGRILPFVGSNNATAMPIVEHMVKGYPGVIRRTINPNYWKDRLHSLIHDNDPTLWMPHKEIGDDYCREMASEHKVFDPQAGLWVWREISPGADNHIWDGETIQCVIAQMCGVGMMVEQPPPRPAQAKERPSWMPDRPTNWSRR